MANAPFAADRGRDNRPGASPTAGGLVCDAQKEPNPGPGTTIPTALYSTEYPAATLAVGQNVRWRWPAKNHANTPAAGTVEVYIANAPNAGDDFTPATPIAAQMSYSSDNGDCLGIGQSTDTADCQGTWTVPTTLAPGRYTIMWWWEFTAGEFYNTCADVMVTAATGGGGGAGGGEAVPPGGGEAVPPGGGSGGGAPSPPLRVSLAVEGFQTDISASDQSAIATAVASTAQVPISAVSVSVSSFSYASDDYSSMSTLGNYSRLDTRTLISIDISENTPTVRQRLQAALPTANAATVLFAAAQIEVFEAPVIGIAQNTPPFQGGGGGGGGSQGGGGSGGVIAVLVLVIIIGCGLFYGYHKHNMSKPHGTPVYATNPMPPPPGGGGLSPELTAAGWQAIMDNAHGRHYYHNNKSGETTWTLPTTRV